MKYNIVRIIIFLSTPQKVFIFLCIFEIIKFLLSYFWNFGFYLD